MGRFAKISTSRTTAPSADRPRHHPEPAVDLARHRLDGSNRRTRLRTPRGCRRRPARPQPTGGGRKRAAQPPSTRPSCSRLSRLCPDRNSSIDGMAAAIPRASGSYRGEPFSGFTHTTRWARRRRPRHLRLQQLGVAALQAVGAQHDDGAAERRSLAPPVQQRLQRLADPGAALPVGHLLADLVQRAIGVLRAERPRHAREPRPEHEHLHPPSRRHRRVRRTASAPARTAPSSR